MSRPSVTEEERAWIVLARSFDPGFRSAFLAAAEDIAAGRKPEPYVAGRLSERKGRFV